jgi:uncharacterized phage protein gp47/JayE
VSYEPRPYRDILRDLLVTLTGGTVREAVTVPAEATGPLMLDKLADRPLRRISHIEGEVEAGETTLPFRFTSADFELISTDPGSHDFDAIRFRPEGRRPVPGSQVLVSYYPENIPVPPLTDLNIGSVVRTLMETVAAEFALQEQLLDQVYRSAFLDTAEGGALDKVVALVGVNRVPAGVPVTRIRFSRTPGSTGQITIPVGTTVSDETGDLRYRTLAPLTLEPGEAERQVLAASVDPRAAPAEASVLTRPEVLIAGVGAVTNPTAASAAGAPETDEALRRRARKALQVASRGTLDALLYGVKGITGVKDASITEFPNGVPGEVKIDVVYAQPGDAAVEAAVARRIAALRPAGIRVVTRQAATVRVRVSLALTLVNPVTPAAALATLKTDAETRVAAVIDAVGPGGTLRQSAMAAAALQDPRIVDAVVRVSANGGEPADGLSLPTGSGLQLVRPFAFEPVLVESQVAGAAAPVSVELSLPLTLIGPETKSAAETAIRLAAESYLSQAAASGSALTFDGLAGAVRDDTRYVLDRSAGAMTVTSEGRFLQLTDGLGSFADTSGRTIELAVLTVTVLNGGGS